MNGKSPTSRLQYLDHVKSGLKAMISQCRSLGLEGIVSKRVDRGYISGRASDWLKTKLRYRENLIIVGYETAGKPAALRSLLAAYFDENSNLQNAGRIGTGWNVKMAGQVLKRLSNLATDNSPLAAKLPASNRSRNRDIQLFWVQPVVVVEVVFANWTESKQLRHASFVGFGHDESPQHVTASHLFAEQRTHDVENLTSAVPLNPLLFNVSQDLPGLSNPDRIVFPSEKITKSDVAAYLYQVNQWLLPHLENRPVSLLRCSEGIDGEVFFQRHPSKGFPSQITVVQTDSEDEPLLSIDDVAGLLASVQISAVELHPWGCRRDDIEHPDRLIMDLDPDESLSWNKVVEAAFIVRSMLTDHGLLSFVKTTGGKGLHIVVPLSRKHEWDEVFTFSKTLAAGLSQAYKTIFVDNMSKSRRRNRIFLDYHRNKRGSTAIAAYSLRARTGAPVSTPITWDELPTIHPMQFTLRTVPERLANIKVDPWSGIALIEQSLKR